MTHAWPVKGSSRRNPTQRKYNDGNMMVNRLFWASALALTLGFAQTQPVVATNFLIPDVHLKADGIAPLPGSSAERVAPYTEFRGHSLVDWHPKTPAMLLRHREASPNTAQSCRLAQPGGKLDSSRLGYALWLEPFVGAAEAIPTKGRAQRDLLSRTQSSIGKFIALCKINLVRNQFHWAVMD